MDAARKIEFIENYLESFRKQLLDDVGNMPESWDGHEIRQLLADRAVNEVDKSVMTGRRLKDYRSVVANHL